MDPATTEASHKVIGCSIEVHKALGPGYDARVYAVALQQELAAQGVKFQADKHIHVKYKDQVVGEVCADLYVSDLFLVSVTARPGSIGTFERLALRAQLKAADLELGLIVNFSERRLKDGLVRVLNIDKINMERGGGEGDFDPGQDGAVERVHDFDGGH